MDVRVLQGDGETQTAPLGARAGGARLVEAVEDVREDILGDAGPVVLDLDEQVVGLYADRDTDRTAAVLQRVADEVREDHVQAARVEARHDAALGVQVDGVQPGTRVYARGDLVGDVHVVEDQPGGARVEAGDLHEVLDQVVEAAGLADDQPDGRFDHRVDTAGLRVEFLFQDLRHGGDRGERRTEFVGHVRHEAAGRLLAGAHVVHALLEGLRGVVERTGEIREFVRTRDAQPGVELALAQTAGRDAEAVHRLEDRRRGGLGEQRRADQGQAGRDAQRPGQRVEVLGLGLQGLEHVAGRRPADHLRAAHQVRLVVVGDALPVQVIGRLVVRGERLLLVHGLLEGLGYVVQREGVQRGVADDRLAGAVLGDEEHAEALAAVGHLARRALQFVLRRVHRQHARVVAHLLLEVAQHRVLRTRQHGLAVEPVRDARRRHGGRERDESEHHDQPQSQTREAHPRQDRPARRGPAAELVVRWGH